MSGLEDLYREIILDHYRSPRNRGELETPPAVRTEGFNPLCGDEIVVYLSVEGDRVAALVDTQGSVIPGGMLVRIFEYNALDWEMVEEIPIDSTAVLGISISAPFSFSPSYSMFMARRWSAVGLS